MSNFDIATKPGLIAYLDQLNIAVLSTASTDGKPYAAVVYFVVDHDLNFYFQTFSDTKKATNLDKNQHIALTTLDVDAMITIQSTGIAEKVEDAELHTSTLKQIAAANAKKSKEQWPPPISKLHSAGKIRVYKYTPHWLRVGNYSSDTNTPLEKNEHVLIDIISDQAHEK